MSSRLYQLKWSHPTSFTEINLFPARKSYVGLLCSSFATENPPLVRPTLITFTLISWASRRRQVFLSSQQNSSCRLRLDSPTPADCNAFQEGSNPATSRAPSAELREGRGHVEGRLTTIMMKRHLQPYAKPRISFALFISKCIIGRLASAMSSISLPQDEICMAPSNCRRTHTLV